MADGQLEVKADRSAICQHEAILFDIIDPDAPEYSVLKNAVLHNFGIGGDMSALPPDFVPLDLFIGFAVRVEVLMKLGLYNQNLNEIKVVYGGMAEKTGNRRNDPGLFRLPVDRVFTIDRHLMGTPFRTRQLKPRLRFVRGLRDSRMPAPAAQIKRTEL